jgi:exopolysaccharide production protein ExoY
MSIRNDIAQKLPARLFSFSFTHGGKRLFDLFFSSCVLLGGAPLYFLLALLIKLSSKGPILYASMRVGKEGKPFKCWKFRTMCVDADARLGNLLKANPQLFKEWQQHSKLKRDPRITAIGQLLRKTSLDELPQFWNVLKGELSVVGPRPHTCDQVEKYLKGKA